MNPNIYHPNSHGTMGKNCLGRTKEHWIFERDERSMQGFLSEDRASTDADRALLFWQSQASGRSYEVVHWEDQTVPVLLTSERSDAISGSDLDHWCAMFGVRRRPANPERRSTTLRERAP